MTAYSKAFELVEKYTNVRWDIDPNTAKQCALIAVEEIIATFIPKNNKKYLCEEIDYWQQVKIEIEKL